MDGFRPPPGAAASPFSPDLPADDPVPRRCGRRSPRGARSMPRDCAECHAAAAPRYRTPIPADRTRHRPPPDRHVDRGGARRATPPTSPATTGASALSRRPRAMWRCRMTGSGCAALSAQRQRAEPAGAARRRPRSARRRSGAAPTSSTRRTAASSARRARRPSARPGATTPDCPATPTPATPGAPTSRPADKDALLAYLKTL